MKISAFIPVFNEESRIKYALTSLKWCDEIIVLDKSSSDNTVKIAEKFGAKVFVINNTDCYNASECDFLFKATGDWVLQFTASDLMSPSLAKEIKRVIETLPSEINTLKLPFHQEVLGISDERSPWGTAKWREMYKKDSLIIDYEGVHGAISVLNKKVYCIDPKYGYMSHLTHVSVDMMLARHIRYWRTEGNSYNCTTLWPAFRHFLRSVKEIVKYRTLFMGWNGVAMAFAYVSYYMLSFLYCWEHFGKGAAELRYKKLREDSIKEWDNYNC